MQLLEIGLVLLFCFTAINVEAKRRKSSHHGVKYTELCADKGPNEFFRLNIEKDDCREVFQCSDVGLIPLRCPSGLVFDIERQTCDWRQNVPNCKQLERSKLKLPTIKTERPLCAEPNKLGCYSKECIDRTLFCDGIPHCADGSDETQCSQDEDPNRSSLCDKTSCKLPDCYCSENGTQIPNDLPRETVPQMIMITFDDAINNNNIDIYKELFESGRTNPNGCSIKATFFLSHKYTNYSAVQDLHQRGHEIAVHSITHSSKERYWSNGTMEQWAKEMAGARIIFERFANITDNSILGIRAPLLKVGGNNQFQMMAEQSFLYDSSMGAPLSKVPLYPYTLHHRMPHKCHGNMQNCPTRSHPIWEVIMNEYDRREFPDDEAQLSGCVMVDQCTNLVTGDLLYNFLNNNFDRHYNSNRAPLGLYFHASWLLNRQFLNALQEWIDEKLQMKDVYFTTVTQMIRWMQNPTPLGNIAKFEPFLQKCKVLGPPACYYPNQCALTTKELPGQTLRLHTCMPCTTFYPWFNTPTGEFVSELNITAEENFLA